MFKDTITTDQMRSIDPLLNRLAEELTLLGTQVGNSTISPLGALLDTVQAQHVALRQGVENLYAAVKCAQEAR